MFCAQRPLAFLAGRLLEILRLLRLSLLSEGSNALE